LTRPVVPRRYDRDVRIDLHTHSNRSDGTDPVPDLVAHARAAGLDVFALTDHDTADGWAEGRVAAEAVGIGFVPGIEISCKAGTTSIHLLGYLVDPSYEPLAAELAHVREGRSGRIPAMVERLNSLGAGITVADVLAQAAGTPSVGRPHVADALVAAGVVADRKEAFDRFLAEGRPAHIERYAIEPGRAIDMVREAGGVPVIAHPWGRGSRLVLTAAEVARLVAEHGLAGLEVDHQDHSPHDRAALREIAVANELIVTGSSDHHGLGKTDHDLGCNTTAPDQFEALLAAAKANAARGTASPPEAFLP
jgi:predicted metal-dependent phosphoesterase TrpH